MSWTRTGTIDITNASATVYGHGTNWISGGLARAADTLIYGGQVLEVASIQSDTQLTLRAAYVGASATSVTYAIIHTGLMPAELASAVLTLQSKYLTTVSQLYDWETSVAATVPITNPATGVTTNVAPLSAVVGALATLDADLATAAAAATTASANAQAGVIAAVSAALAAASFGTDLLSAPRNAQLGSAAYADLHQIPQNVYPVMVSTNYQATPDDASKVLIVSGTTTITLPAAMDAYDATRPYLLTVKAQTGATVTVARSGSDTIDTAAANKSLTANTALRFVAISNTTWESI